MACCGDTPTLETLAAVTILRDAMPEQSIVISVRQAMRMLGVGLKLHQVNNVDNADLQFGHIERRGDGAFLLVAMDRQVAVGTLVGQLMDQGRVTDVYKRQASDVKTW